MPTDLQPQPERRISALDGIRGFLTVMVVLSHFFAEVPHGVKLLGCGFIAVDAFFVLSGLLVGRLILDKGHHANFFPVFYLRRICRTFPVYFACVAASLAVASFVPGMPLEGAIPLWSYLAFAQNFFMATAHGVGTHWLAPTWTLAVEEQFYLVVPALMLAVPRKWLVPTLCAIVVASVAFRTQAVVLGGNGFALALLPSRADGLAIGLLAAVFLSRRKSGWDRLSVRATAPVLLLAGVLSERVGLLQVVGHTLLAGSAAAFLLTLVADAPEAARFKGKALAFLGNTSFATYLTHLPILWAAHAIFRHAEPSLADARGWVVTLACLPVVVLVAWGVTALVERPLTAYGRPFKWSDARRGTRAVTATA